MPHDPSQQAPQGPANPEGRGGIDAPAPPGGPQRADAPAGPDSPGTPAPDPGPQVERVTKREDTGDVPPPHGDERDQSGAEQDAQRENAETSLDEPSDGSGGE